MGPPTSDFKVSGGFLRSTGMILELFGALQRKIKSISSAKHSPPSLLSEQPIGQNSIFSDFTGHISLHFRF